MNGDSAGGAFRPWSPSFDPGASEFVPTSTSYANAAATPSHQPSVGLGLYGSFAAPASATVQPAAPSDRKPAKQPMPLSLYPSSVWSPVTDRPIRSAGLPSKASWDSFPSQRSPLHAEQAVGSSMHPHLAEPHSASMSSNGMPHSPLPSFDNTTTSFPSFDNTNTSFSASRNSNGRTGVSRPLALPTLRYTQTEEYHNSSSDTSPSFQLTTGSSSLASSSGWPPLGTASSASSGFSQYQKMPDSARSVAPPSTSQSPGERNSDDSGSVVISDHYTQTHPEQKGAKGEVWTERQHAKSLRRALRDSSVEWIEAYPGAITILTAVNPQQYQMPYGTRVINIKTEYTRNVLKSISSGKYSVMAKVAERIMKIWESRDNASEKVLFLFSINGSKKFLGIAEMSGPWNKEDSIEDWENNPDSEPATGTFPVTWVYIKDVAYHQFAHISQPNNGHPVGNMWNGMNFPSETGRKVIEQYVKTPATSSVLGYPRSNESHQQMAVANPRGGSDRRGVSNGTRGGFQGGRGGFHSGPAASSNWRRPNGGNSSNGSDDDQTSLVSKQSAGHVAVPGGIKRTASGKLPLYSLVWDERGKLSLVPVDELPSNKGSSAGASSEDKSDSSPDLQRTFTHPAGDVGSHVSLPYPAMPVNDAAFQHLPVMAPHGFAHSYGHYGDRYMFAPKPRAADETPTHRPAPHGERHGAPTSARTPFDPESPIRNLSGNMLMAKYHSLTAEEYTIISKLCEPGLDEMTTRLFNARLARVAAEKNLVQGELRVKSAVPFSTDSSPTRRDSFGNGDRVSASSSYNISPVRAEDGRRLRSVSKLVSPLAQGYEPTEFDKAPGGSGREKRQSSGQALGHSVTNSWDSNVKKSIDDLLKSPEKTPVPTRPAHETSSFFAEHPTARKTPTFPNPIHVGGTPRSAAHKNFSFPMLNQNNGSPAPKNFSFTGPAQVQGDGNPKPTSTNAQTYGFFAPGGGVNLK